MFIIKLLNFLLLYIIFLSCFFFFNYCIVKIKKFFILIFCNYDIWTYIDDFIRFCPNNTLYNNYYNYYILDYEYFEIIDMIYYHNTFFDSTLELIFYFDFLHETRTREDDEHELYRFLSTYIIPLHYKYYIIEHYCPLDEYGYFIFKNFYDFNDLEYEFKFIREEFFGLCRIYYKEIHSRTIFFNEDLYYNNLEEIFIYDRKYHFFKKNQINPLTLKSNRNIFLKKETRTFNFEEPSKELELKKYMTWFLLKKKFDVAKFDYDIFCSLPPYEIFDKNYYDLKLNNYNNLIDAKTKYRQFIEVYDEYFNNCINSNNSINYFFKNGLMKNYIKKTLNYINSDIVDINYHYLYIKFDLRIKLLYLYLIYILKVVFVIFLILTCWFSLNYYDYSFDFDLHFSYIRSLVRSKSLNEYNDFKDLIFNFYHDTSELNKFFVQENELRLCNSKCSRDRRIFPDKFSF